MEEETQQREPIWREAPPNVNPLKWTSKRRSFSGSRFPLSSSNPLSHFPPFAASGDFLWLSKEPGVVAVEK